MFNNKISHWNKIQQIINSNITIIRSYDSFKPKRMFEGLFQTTLKRKKTRQRFYSSMNYDQYYLLYGPPAPITKPLEDPTEDIPPLELEEDEPKSEEEKQTKQTQPKLPPLELHPFKLETIYEIDGSENQTHTLFKSPRLDFKDSKTLKVIQEEYSPKRMRVRNRSQSDNSEYLIFNFLQRQNQKGHKKTKAE